MSNVFFFWAKLFQVAGNLLRAGALLLFVCFSRKRKKFSSLIFIIHQGRIEFRQWERNFPRVRYLRSWLKCWKKTKKSDLHSITPLLQWMSTGMLFRSFFFTPCFGRRTTVHCAIYTQNNPRFFARFRWKIVISEKKQQRSADFCQESKTWWRVFKARPWTFVHSNINTFSFHKRRAARPLI